MHPDSQHRWSGRRRRRLVQSAAAAVSLTTLLAVGTVTQAQGSSTLGGRTPTPLGATVGDTTNRSTQHEGAAFAMTNSSSGNRVVTYERASNGRLTRVGSVATRGRGIGTDLDTQGGLLLSRDHRYLYAANAGSDNVTVFAVDGTELTFLQKVYAGDVPNSLTIHDDLLYVLDGSVAGNGILGFRVADDGTLTPLRGSFRLLSSPIAVPGQVQFSPDGRLLLVTQKTTNTVLSPQNAIDVFRIRSDGTPTAIPRREASHGLRPFSLAFRNNHHLVVVESFNAAPGLSAASSYEVSPNGALDVISGSVPNGQTDTCWVVITRDGRFAFTANFGSGTISSYRFGSEGVVTLTDGNAAFTGVDSQPVDLALRPNSRHLYMLLRDRVALRHSESKTTVAFSRWAS